MTDLVVVADDLTGAMDTGHGFAEREHETSVVTTTERAAALGSTSVVAADTDTRYVTPDSAGSAVTRVVERTQATTVYKKVDSTLRGNVGTEVVAALAAADADLALVAPAFPRAGRRTVGGAHYVDGDPVTETEYGDDPNAPHTAVLAELFETHDGPVTHLDADVIDGGPEQVGDELDDVIDGHSEAPIVCCDAATDAALSTVASAGERYDTVYAGSGGLAAHVSVPAPATAPTEMATPRSGAPLAVVGSASSTTFTQLARLPAEFVVNFDGAEMVLDEWRPDITTVLKRLSDGRPTVLTAATGPEDVQQTLDAGHKRGQSPASVRDRVTAGLAAAARMSLEATRPSGLVLTGGDTAVATLRALDATAVDLTGKALGTGVPLGVVRDGDAAGLGVATKAGGFGHPDTLAECLDALLPA